MKIVNLTPHDPIVIQLPDGQRISIPSSGMARVATSQASAGDIDGIPLRRTAWGDVVGLPPPADDTVFVVSAMVADRVRRPDVVSPDTGPSAIRDGGNIVAVTALIVWA